MFMFFSSIDFYLLFKAFKIRLLNTILKFTTCVIYVIQVILNSLTEHEYK